MKTSRYDLWDVISWGTGGAPPSLYLVRQQPARGQNHVPWVLRPDICTTTGTRCTSWVYGQHLTL